MEAHRHHDPIVVRALESLAAKDATEPDPDNSLRDYVISQVVSEFRNNRTPEADAALEARIHQGLLWAANHTGEEE